MAQPWNIEEAIGYYQKEGAPQNQQALVQLLREIQEEQGGAISAAALAQVAQSLSIKETFLAAILKRYPSLRTQEAPHRLEICGGPNCAKQRSASLLSFLEQTYGVTPGGISKQGGFSLHVTGCMKHCGKGPNIKWDGKVYNGAEETLLQKLISQQKKQTS